jgi:serine protease Do
VSSTLAATLSAPTRAPRAARAAELVRQDLPRDLERDHPMRRPVDRERVQVGLAGATSGSRWRLLLTAAVLVGLCARAWCDDGHVASASATPVSARDLARAISDAFQEAVDRVLPAVVTIRAYSETGCGVVVRLASDGPCVILTNNHVVEGVEEGRVEFVLTGGRPLKPTRALRDPRSDVAVLVLEERDLPCAVLGDSDQARVGQWVLAIGSPFDLDGTVTHGIISARGRRSLELSSGEGGHAVINQDFLQTDAPIHPGNSGGPLVNLDGEVIGLNTAVASSSGAGEGIGFAIPSNLARRIAEELLRKGVVQRSYLGVHLGPGLDAALAEKLGLDRVRGALISEVYADTPAAKAGLEPFDVILEFNGQTIEDEDHLRNAVSLSPADRPLPMVVWRNRERVTVTVRLANRDQYEQTWPQSAAGSRESVSPALEQLGITAVTLKENLRRKLALRDDVEGLVIVSLHPHRRPVLDLELLDVIVAINGQSVRSVGDAEKILAGAKPEGGLMLNVLRSTRKGPVTKSFEIKP